MIHFNDVTKIYNGNVKAIEDMNFTVEKGELVIMLGPSGCGKTTLLRMVNQLESITDGDIMLNGKSVRHSNKIEMRRNIGYVIQSNGLFPNMNIEDNAMIVPNLLGWDRKKMRDRFNTLMELVGLNPDEYRKRYPHELSGGQQQRVGVARALAADPPVMLMDEPFGALDPIIRTHLQEEFLQIQKELKKTILFVSHDIDEAVKMADKIALLKGGKMMQYAEPARMLNKPANSFVAEFVGQDRVLKSMSLYTVKDLANALTLKPVLESPDSQNINENLSLRVAISKILNQEADQLIVENDNGTRKGSITLDLIEQFLHREIKESV
ncbi:ABC transporter ATP-binding protein [Terribacillus saccharophilus]|jgi:osmoprotectant transport system ATP-binding protein|uniref:Carnitine transport ATP-binding protein OpuCA n=1 Tax=Terribacillus saccharophilus TaxID=361277 RepID=A0A268HD78_9BACI|nr:ABC transporter ATP-binding protein [Terribacillus saccharophilus]MEC0304489.1 ABC transporter ATP-binding protein [Terribacillus saccharophilus]PAD36641.1 glycine/betaine ABC transporter ATP-binding protein [Terribacillus saccharophilus]PAD97623.1 glycine/betaine ABC transporter ATP-binding protein [Terribacillus saccharophilus]PAE01670.1 glycine/betaine ABC transporter ATP-binding protein [Terribacillus saccharophilus]PAE07831.1 glycine/betaine ABC transporter ATP-binding protein [Terriba